MESGKCYIYRNQLLSSVFVSESLGI